MEKSKAFTLNTADMKKILKGLALAMGGAGVAYLLGILDVIDVDAYSPLYVSAASALLNIVKVWIEGESK